MSSLILYFSSFLFSATLGSFFGKNYVDKKRLNRIFIIICIMFAPVLLSCLREGIGKDYANYLLIFQSYTLIDFKSMFSQREFLNLAITKFGFWLVDDVRVVFAIYAVLTWGLLFAALCRYRNNASFFVASIVLLISVYSASYNIVRQCLAVAIVIYCYKYIEEGKFWRYFIGIVLASLAHTTALVMIVLYFIYPRNRRYNQLKTLFVVVGMVAFLILSEYLLPVILDYFSFEYYSEFYESSTTSVYPHLITKLPVLAVLFAFFRTNTKNNPYNLFLYLLILLDFCLLFSVATKYQWGFRLTYYLSWAYAILCGATVNNQKNKVFQWGLGIFFVAWYFFDFYLKYFSWNWDGIFPYRSFL